MTGHMDHSLPWASTAARHITVLILATIRQIFIRVDANVVASIFVVRIDNPLRKEELSVKRQRHLPREHEV